MKERESYQTSTHSFFEEFSAISLLSIKDSVNSAIIYLIKNINKYFQFTLEKTTSTYTLSIEVPTAIDNILLQSNVSLKLIDVEKNSAVVSYSDSDTNVSKTEVQIKISCSKMFQCYNFKIGTLL